MLLFSQTLPFLWLLAPVRPLTMSKKKALAEKKVPAGDDGEALLDPVLPQTDFPTHVLNKERLLAFAERCEERDSFERTTANMEASKRCVLRVLGHVSVCV